MPDDVDDDFEDEPAEIDEDFEEELDDELEEDDLEVLDETVDEDELAEEDEEEDEELEGADTEPAGEEAGEEAEEEDDDDEVLGPDDVEADLDSILKERLVVVDEEDEEDEEDEPVDFEDKGESTRVRPRSPGEFVCQSCFLVKHPSQLADAARQFCSDCI